MFLDDDWDATDEYYGVKSCGATAVANTVSANRALQSLKKTGFQGRLPKSAK